MRIKKNKWEYSETLTRMHFKFTKQRNELRINDFIGDYKTDDTIWSDETPLMKKIKYIIFNVLSEQERNLILYYAQVGKQKKVSDALGVSLASTHKQLSIIRDKIKYYLKHGVKDIN